MISRLNALCCGRIRDVGHAWPPEMIDGRRPKPVGGKELRAEVRCTKVEKILQADIFFFPWFGWGGVKIWNFVYTVSGARERSPLEEHLRELKSPMGLRWGWKRAG